MSQSNLPLRDRLLRSALEIELISVGWIMTEAILSAIAAFQASSLSLSAFSVDSAIELLAGMVLSVRLFTELHAGGVKGDLPKKLERYTSGIMAVCLFLLAGYISFKSGGAIHRHQGPELSLLGLCTAAASSVITPWLALQKMRYGRLLGSPSLMADAMCSFTCAYMSWTLLAGLGLNDLFHWWWVDALAATGILYFVLQEAWESWESFQTGEPHVHGHGHGHHHHH